MRDYTQLLEAYFRDLVTTQCTGGGVKEESYYDALSNLLSGIGSGLKPRVRCILQLGNRGAGRPDGGLFSEDQWKQGDQQQPLLGLPQPPNRGVIEVKQVSDDAWVTASGGQVSRYWQHYRLVMVTNYGDFVLVGQDKAGNPARLESYRLADGETDFWTQAAPPGLREKTCLGLHGVPPAGHAPRYATGRSQGPGLVSGLLRPHCPGANRRA